MACLIELFPIRSCYSPSNSGYCFATSSTLYKGFKLLSIFKFIVKQNGKTILKKPIFRYLLIVYKTIALGSY